MRFDQARYPNGTKKRRHHNNSGATQIKRGRVYEEVRSMAQRLGIPYRARDEASKSKENT